MVLEDQDLIIKSVLMVFSDLYFCVQGQNRRFFPYTGNTVRENLYSGIFDALLRKSQ